jgi:hypothetical protein
MKATTPLPLLAALALLVAAPSAQAAPAKLAGGPVSASGAATVKITNPNRYTLRGTVSLASGKTKLASRKVTVKRKRSKFYSLKLSAAGLRALRSRGSLAATVQAKLAHGKGRAKVYRKALVLKAPGANGTPGSGSTPGAGQPGAGGNGWTATTSMGGTFPLTVDGDKVTMTQPTFQPVSCSEGGGLYRVSLSSELFDLVGPWQLGNQDGTQTQMVPRVNTLVTSGARTVTYRLKTSRTGNQIAGTLVQSFSDSKLDFSTYPARLVFVNCAGTLNFTAVPAP